MRASYLMERLSPMTLQKVGLPAARNSRSRVEGVRKMSTTPRHHLAPTPPFATAELRPLGTGRAPGAVTFGVCDIPFVVYLPLMSPAQLAVELRARRLRAGWTQTELAQAIGSTQPAVARVEAGGVIPSLPFVDRWVAATGYPLTITLGESPKTLTPRQKGQLVRDVLGDDVFDPWERLDEKRARGMNIEPERRYLMSTGRPRKKAKAPSRLG